MKEDYSNYLAPFIWTGEQIIDALTSIPSYELPYKDVLFSAKSLLVLVTDIENSGINFFSTLLEDNQTVNCKIIVCLYPNCLTNQKHTEKLINLEQKYYSRVEIRVLLLDNREDILASIYCIKTSQDKTVLSLGSVFSDLSYEISSSLVSTKRLNLVFTPEDDLLEPLYKWYEHLWLEHTIFLDEAILNVFSVNFLSTKDNNKENKIFNNRELTSKEEHKDKVLLNGKLEKSEQVIKLGANPVTRNSSSPIELLGLFRPDPFALKIAKIYELGEIVTLDRKKLIPPLDVPIKAEWLGVKGVETIGDLTQETRYRISVIDEKPFKQIEKKKNSVRDLINNFTFSMGENLRWMPLEAKLLFDKELDKINTEGKELINKTLGDNIWEYLDKRRTKIKEDIQKIQKNFVAKTKEGSSQLNMLFLEEELSQRELSIEKQLSPSDISRETVLSQETEYIGNILNEIAKRLIKVKECNFIPSVNYNKIAFNYKESKWSSPWSQALNFLISIAEFSRRGTYEKFLQQTPSIAQEEYIKAMDVCNDALFKLKEYSNFSYEKKKALQQLEYITRNEQMYLFEEMEDGDKNKCAKVFNLIKYNIC